MLLYVGRYTAVKRIPLLIRAHARARARFARRAPLVLLGGFPGEWEGEHPLDAIARETGDPDVFLAGWRGHEDLPDGLNAADLLVLPSVREQFGAVLVEAMACGLPVIAVDAHGPAEIVDAGETGWLVPPDDEEAMVEALVEAVNGDAERRRRGDARLRGRTRPLRLAGARARARARVRGGASGAAGGRRRAYADRGISSTRSILEPAIPYRIRRSARARHARIVVDGAGVEVVVPRGFAAAAGRALRGGEAGLDRAHARGACASPRRSCRRRAWRTAARCPTWASGCRFGSSSAGASARA